MALDHKNLRESGFTLFEVMLTMVILMSLTGAAVMAIRNSLDIREKMGEKAMVGHRLNVVMQKLVADLEHAFILSTLNVWSNPVGRATKSIFEIETDGSLRLTTMSHQALLANSHESDQTLVVYELKDDKNRPGTKSLFRGETPYIPLDLNENIPMEVIAEGVKVFAIAPWTGQSWAESKWSTMKSEHRNMLPRMVRINLELLDLFPDEEVGERVEDMPSSQMSTIVYLPRSWGFKEYKPFNSGTLQWN